MARRRSDGRGGWTLLSLGVPALVLGWMVWFRRWMSDDGFINVRVVHQILAGNGPVYNLNERVEVGTSTLWIWLVTLGQWLLPGWETGHVMVALGTLLTVVAAVALGRGAMHANGEEPGIVLPMGLAVLAGLPPVWDFGTSGLETSLSMAWISLCFYALARRWSKSSWTRPMRAWQPLHVAWLIGLGPLVRPDLALVSLVFGIMLILQSKVSWRGWLGAIVVALSTPVAYEVFRMGYYASLVPNTALAKANAPWAQGVVYFLDYVGTYRLWIPAVIALLVIIAGTYNALGERDPGRVALWVGPLLAASVHVLFVMSVGGDFMHARFLLPATFLFFAPVAVVLGRPWKHVGAVAVIAWAVVAGLMLRPALWNGQIVDERSYYSTFVPDRPGAMVIASNWKADVGYQLTQRAARDLEDNQSYFVDIANAEEKIPTRRGDDVVVAINSLGIAGVGAGLRVIMVDPPSLGDPIGARLRLPDDAQYRVGHAYKPVVWAIARYASPDYKPGDKNLADARAVLGCGDVPTLLHAVSDPMTPDRFFRNLWLAPKLTWLRIPVDPAQARAQVCEKR